MSAIERIEVHHVDALTPFGRLRATRAVLSNVTLPAPGAAAGPSRLAGLRIGELRLEGAALDAASLPTLGSSRRRWRVEPLATLSGTVRADVADAAWRFDADVTIPIDDGRVDFDRASVEHVGPDSSMGVSRMGVYVDAPNGRTYLYLFSATHLPGVRFEQRGLSLASWTSDRGAIELRPLVECALSGMAIGALAAGAGDRVARARLGGELQLGDGAIDDGRSRFVLAGRAEGRNRVELSSAAEGGGLVLRVPELSLAEVRIESDGLVVSSGAVSAMLSVQVDVAGRATTVAIAEATLRGLACVEAASA